MDTISGLSHRVLHVLVADDNDALRLAVASMLRLMGHEADSVRNGLEAVDAAAKVRYDAVLLDVQMPVMGGFEAASHLKGSGPRLIGMSGDVAEGECFRAAGADDFLAKPVRIADLVRAFGRTRPGPDARCGSGASAAPGPKS